MRKTRYEIRILGQVTLEFTFALIVIVLLVLGMIRVFQWGGKDLYQRRLAHETLLESNVPPLNQLEPYFYSSTTFNAAKPSNVFGDEYW